MPKDLNDAEYRVIRHRSTSCVLLWRLGSESNVEGCDLDTTQDSRVESVQSAERYTCIRKYESGLLGRRARTRHWTSSEFDTVARAD